MAPLIAFPGLLILGVLLAPWLVFLLPTHRHGFGVAGTAIDSIWLALAIVALVLVAKNTTRRSGALLYGLVYLVANLIVSFAFLYWQQGTARDFTHALTRVDAIYVAVGTLSTAGTGNIAAISEPARTIQIIQMILDLGLVLFAVSVVVVRFMAPESTHLEPSPTLSKLVARDPAEP
jgi:hypothetical protein